MTDGERISAMIELISKLTERVRRLEAQARKDRREEVMQAADALADDVAVMRSITEAVAIEAGLTLADLRGPKRKQRYARVRHKAWARCHEQGYSLPVIGRYFNGRDHTTIWSGIRQYRAMMVKRVIGCETPAK